MSALKRLNPDFASIPLAKPPQGLRKPMLMLAACYATKPYKNLPPRATRAHIAVAVLDEWGVANVKPDDVRHTWGEHERTAREQAYAALRASNPELPEQAPAIHIPRYGVGG